MATLIGFKKLGISQVESMFDCDEHSLSKGVYTSPRYKRNTVTGEVLKEADKVATDYFMHKIGSCTIHRRHITKAAAAAIMSRYGKTLKDIPELHNY